MSLTVIYNIHVGIIITPPTDVIVFLHASANFTCEVNGGSTGWKVNGISYNNLPTDKRREMNVSQDDTAKGNVLLTLAIPGKGTYNGTIVVCVVGDHSRLTSPEESEGVTMRVQGTAQPPDHPTTLIHTDRHRQKG